MGNSIRISEKHGVNPTIPHCFFCNEPKNELILMGKLPGDAEAPKGAIFDKQPCHQCFEYMKQGVILISVRDEKEPKKDHEYYRTGGWCVVKEDFILRAFQPAEVAQAVVKARVAFVSDDAWEKMGLPRGEVKE